MSLLTPERLYQLLPAIHRQRDVAQGEPLRALLAVIERELEALEADTARLYDSWFIETCDEWTVPYIGDLLGVRPIRPVASAGVSMRAWVANTLAYRRRKGTARVLEQLARDVSGWPAVAVEFFQRLGTTQHVNHVRPHALATATVRDAVRSARTVASAGAFDAFAHTLEVRSAATRGGRFNIPNLGLFLWRLRAQFIGAGLPGDEGADFLSACRNSAGFWHLHPAGVDAPLFNRPRGEAGDGGAAATDIAQLPAALRTLELHGELEQLRAGQSAQTRFISASDPALRIFVQLDGEAQPVEVPPADIHLCEIPDPIELAVPPQRVVAIDVERGRLAFPATLRVRQVWLHAAHGSVADIGGGPYERRAALQAASAGRSNLAAEQADEGGFFDAGVWQVGVSHLLPADDSTVFGSLRAALAAWNAQPAGRTGVIVLMDSLSEIDDGGVIDIDIGSASALLIVAGQWPQLPLPGAPAAAPVRQPGRFEARQVRAHWQGQLRVRGKPAAGAGATGALCVHGVLLQGSLSVEGALGELELAHCTILAQDVPDAVALKVGADSTDLQLRLLACQSGPIAVAGPVRGLAIVDSIVGIGDRPEVVAALDAPAAPLDVQRTSFFGAVNALTLNASDCIFDGPVLASRRQLGCVRFSYVPPGSTVPRAYRCQPQLEIDRRLAALREQAGATGRASTPGEESVLRAEVEARLRPLFVSRRYGDPALGQLALRCAPQIREGAASGAEMGAFEHLQQPQRLANLRDAVDEYLRLGLVASVHFAN